jgi:hypothetical protein
VRIQTHSPLPHIGRTSDNLPHTGDAELGSEAIPDAKGGASNVLPAATRKLNGVAQKLSFRTLSHLTVQFTAGERGLDTFLSTARHKWNY